MRLVYFIISIGIIACLGSAAIAKNVHKHKYSKATIATKHHTHRIKKSTLVKRKPPKRVLASQPKPVKQVRSEPEQTIAAKPVVYQSRQLSNRLNEIINGVDENADIGVVVKSMRNGEWLYSRQVHQSFTPASTLKVLTAEAALLFLKPEYRFTTQLLTDAKSIKNGVLQGNLYIMLSGDPSLTYNDLFDLMLNLKAQQVTSIAGNVYIDTTAYDQNFYGPGWDGKDKGYCYAAPISASIINHNCLPFKVLPSNVAGQAAHVEKSPNYFYPSIRNNVVTKPNRSPCSVHLSNTLSDGLEIEGCMPKGKDAWGVSYVVTDVPEYSRALFKSVLNELNIKLQKPVVFGGAPKHLTLIAYHASQPLSELINEMLKKSDNIIAGALFKKLGQLYTRQPGSWQNGSLAVTQILSKTAGVNTAGLKDLDGSGLSPSNVVTPSQMMQVLDFAYHHSTSETFITALPIAGVDGTLKHRMGNIAHKVRAKTGYISGVVGLAGYVDSGDKDVLAFVIMVNGSKGMTWKYKEMEDKIATALAQYKQ